MSLQFKEKVRMKAIAKEESGSGQGANEQMVCVRIPKEVTVASKA